MATTATQNTSRAATKVQQPKIIQQTKVHLPPSHNRVPILKMKKTGQADPASKGHVRRPTKSKKQDKVDILTHSVLSSRNRTSGLAPPSARQLHKLGSTEQEIANNSLTRSLSSSHQNYNLFLNQDNTKSVSKSVGTSGPENAAHSYRSSIDHE